ncbi:Protein of unknown function, partial [Gryllus bimaculatus]
MGSRCPMGPQQLRPDVMRYAVYRGEYTESESDLLVGGNEKFKFNVDILQNGGLLSSEYVNGNGVLPSSYSAPGRFLLNGTMPISVINENYLGVTSTSLAAWVRRALRASAVSDRRGKASCALAESEIRAAHGLSRQRAAPSSTRAARALKRWNAHRKRRGCFR